MDIIKSKDCGNGIVVNIVYDYDCECPRSTNDYLGIIYSNHRNYNPDKHSLNELDKNYMCDTERLDKDYIWSPVYYYEHGSIALSTARNGQFADRWDSGLFGIIAVNKTKVRKEYNVTRISPKLKERVLQCLYGEIEELSDWYEDECFGYEVVNTNTNEVLESCYGYIGWHNIDNALNDGIYIANSLC